MKIKKISITFFLIVCAFGLNAQTIQEKIAECEKYWDPEVLERANTAKDADYLSEVSKQAIYFSNLARFDGPLFIKTFLTSFSNDWHIKSRTEEEWNTLIQALSNAKGLAAFIPDQPLARAAQSHAEDKDKNAHTSGDGTGASERVRGKFGCAYYRAEIIAFGHFENGLQAVLEWLVDSQNGPTYGHRNTILSKNRIYIGVGLATFPNAHDCMVFDCGIWHYTNDEVLDFVYKNFPSKLIKTADIARNLDYLSYNEKNIIMLANIVRIAPELYYTKIYGEFVPWYVDKDETFHNEFMKYYDRKRALLYPDKKIQKQLCDNCVKDGHHVEEPSFIDGETRGNQYNKYMYTFDYLDIIKCSYAMWLDSINFAMAIKFLTRKEGGAGVFVKIAHDKSTDNFDNQGKIITLDDVMGADYDYHNNNDNVPPILPPKPYVDNEPIKLLLDAVTDYDYNYSDDESPQLDDNPAIYEEPSEDKPLHFLIDAQTDDGDYDPDDEEYDEYDD